MKDLKLKLSEYKEKWQVFGGKGALVEIFEGVVAQLEALIKENEALKKEIAAISKPSAEYIRDKLHTLEGEEQLNGDFIKNNKTELSPKYFVGEKDEKGNEYITLKEDILNPIKFIKEGM